MPVAQDTRPIRIYIRIWINLLIIWDLWIATTAKLKPALPLRSAHLSLFLESNPRIMDWKSHSWRDFINSTRQYLMQKLTVQPCWTTIAATRHCCHYPHTCSMTRPWWQKLMWMHNCTQKIIFHSSLFALTLMIPSPRLKPVTTMMRWNCYLKKPMTMLQCGQLMTGVLKT